MQDELLTTAQVAKITGVSARTLEGWRRRGEGPPYVKLAPHTVRYDPEALAAWLRMKAVQPEPCAPEPPKLPEFPFAQRRPARKGHHRLGGHRTKPKFNDGLLRNLVTDTATEGRPTPDAQEA